MRLVKSFALIAVLSMPFASTMAADGEPEHEHEPVRMQPVHESTPAEAAQRFATDDTLRRNMREIRDAVDALSAAGAGRPDAARTVALSKGIAGGVLDIIEHCKLPPDADAELHRIIHPLMLGAQALEAEPADASPLASMREALDAYGRRFDDPAFALPADADVDAVPGHGHDDDHGEP